MSFNENNTQNVSGNINKNSNQNYDQNQVNNSTTNSQNVNYQPNYNMNNASTYQSVKQPKVKNKNSSNFGKTILIPFVSGILGTVLVIGACLESRNKKWNF